MIQTQQRFLSIESAAIFTVGRLQGLAATTRFDINPELKQELLVIAKGLADEVKKFEELKEKKEHSTK